MMTSMLRIVFLISLIVSMVGCCGSSDGGAPSAVSTAGSTAAMLVHKSALYTLKGNDLEVYDISENKDPVKVDVVALRAPETLFIHEDHLYIGGQFGVAIYDVIDPLSPVDVSFYQHIRGCDPVIVEDVTGYVTLRGHQTCNSSQNRLEVVDFSDPENPQKISEYPMTNPQGLAKTPDFLAVCEREYGLTLLNVDDPQQISEVASFPMIQCFDAIFKTETLLVTATDGIYQFDASDSFLDLLSQIPVGEDQELDE